jgi:hypothetical protein
MRYAEFEKRVVDTFNRMHIVESCDDGFIEGGYEWDVGNILSKAMKDMFHITGHSVSREVLMNLYLDDLDGFLIEALDSFNGIMDRYNVVPDDTEQYTMCSLRII